MLVSNSMVAEWALPCDGDRDRCCCRRCQRILNRIIVVIAHCFYCRWVLLTINWMVSRDFVRPPVHFHDSARESDLLSNVGALRQFPFQFEIIKSRVIYSFEVFLLWHHVSCMAFAFDWGDAKGFISTERLDRQVILDLDECNWSSIRTHSWVVEFWENPIFSGKTHLDDLTHPMVSPVNNDWLLTNWSTNKRGVC